MQHELLCVAMCLHVALKLTFDELPVSPHNLMVS